MTIARRDFLKGAVLFSAMGVAPAFLTRAVTGAQPAIAGFRDDRVLVVIQLGGGNDGLNSVVPYGDDAYYRVRPTLGLRPERVLKLDDYLGLNDKLTGLKALYDDGLLGLIQGVGYPNPDRSHFRSMEIWHTASESDEYLGTGWIGRYFDNSCSGSARPQAGVAVMESQPQAFGGDKGFGIAFDSPDGYGWTPGRGADTLENFERINSVPADPGSTLDFLRHTTSNAIMSAAEVQEATRRGGFRSAGGRQQDPLELVAALIRGGLETRIFYVAVSGFDTHANQAGQHDRLLELCGNRIKAFQDTLRRDGTADRVLTMVFSEFGRRVAENGSRGTDHGTAAPMFLIGQGVKPGLHGAAPSLTDLSQGDLKHSTDFRAVYASVLDGWFHTDPKLVLRQSFEPLPIIA